MNSHQYSILCAFEHIVAHTQKNETTFNMYINWEQHTHTEECLMVRKRKEVETKTILIDLILISLYIIFLVHTIKQRTWFEAICAQNVNKYLKDSGKCVIENQVDEKNIKILRIFWKHT